MKNSTVAAAIEEIRKYVPAGRLLENEPMSNHTSFRIGGPAAAFVIVNNEEELSHVLQVCTKLDAEHMVIGNGSNFLVGDAGYPGIMIRLGADGEFGNIFQYENEPTKVGVGASKLLSATSVFLAERGLSGFEPLSGIPGSIGGAVFMNAGAYGGEMKDVVKKVRLIKPDDGSVLELATDELDFGYRHSMLEESGLIAVYAELELKEDDPEAIQARMAEFREKRNSKQPVEYPSAGSTFKRPVGGFAAALIDEAGLRGYRVGGAMVSEKHAGFVINAGGATAENVLSVMRHCREVVFEKSGIMLEPEVRLINCEL